MEIQKNSRQIPSNEIYTADKKYNDLLYGYLQHISVWDKENNVRYIPKKVIKYTELASVLGVSRQTVSSKFNNLIKKGLIVENSEKGIYELVTLDATLAALLPDETVRIICNTLKERCLSILTYLLKTYIQHNEQPCQINLDIIKNYIGLCASNKGYNNQIVLDCFGVLQQLGLIQYHSEKIKDEKTGGLKSIYVLDKVSNKTALQKC